MDPFAEMAVGDVLVAPDERRAFVGDTELMLTRREFDILAALARRPGWVFSPEQLADTGPAEEYASPCAVNVHVTHLRAKLARAGAPDLIVTVRGAGWRIRKAHPAPLPPRDDTAPFSGRVREVALLSEALVAAPGAFTLITGEAGIGKTTLVEHVLASHAPRLEVVRAVCDGNGSGDYWAWRQILGELERRTATRLAEQPDGHLITRLLSPGPGPDALTGADRTLAYDAVRRYLEAVVPGRSRPLVIFVDDIQWADDASLKLFLFVLRRSATLPCHLVTAARDSTIRARPPLEALFEHAASRRDALLLKLCGLDAAETLSLATSVLGPNAAGSISEGLLHLTGGNPLFLAACLGELRARPGEHVDLDALVAPSVLSLVRSQVEQLPEPTRIVLGYAAAAGVAFDPGIVAGAAGSASATSAFDAALDAEILVPAQLGHLRFRHALFRDALLEGLPLPDREHAHLRIAQEMEQRGSEPESRVFRLAHHYSNAGAAYRGKAIGCLVAAARASSEHFAFEDAMGRLAAAKGLVPTAGYDDLRARRVTAAVLERLGSVCAALGNRPSTIAHYEEALAARPAIDAMARARLCTRLAAAHILLRHRAESERAFGAALATLERVPVRDTGWWRAWIEVRLEQAQGTEIMDTPLPFSLEADLRGPVLEHGTAAQRSKYFASVASHLCADGRWRVPEEAIEAMRSAVEEADRSGSEFLQGSVGSFFGSLLVMRRSSAEAEPVLRVALSRSRHCADSLGEAAALFNLAAGARIAGDVRMVEVHARELERVAAERAPLPEFVSGALAHRSWIALRRGDVGEAARLSADAIGLWEADPACSQTVWLMAWPAVSCALAAGDVTRAVELAVLMTRPDQQSLGEELDHGLAAAISLHTQGRVDRARERLVALEAPARELGYA